MNEFSKKSADLPGLAAVLPWDTNFFHHKIARLIPPKLSSREFDLVDQWAETEGIECVYFLADFNSSDSIIHAQEKNWRMMDIRMTLQLNLSNVNVEPSQALGTTISIHPAYSGDIPAIQAIASYSHTASRFYFDPQFKREKCDELYKVWIKRNCLNSLGLVLVPKFAGEPIGYLSCSISDSGIGQIEMVGIHEQHRGKGVANELIMGGIRWFQERAVKNIEVVTQARNIPAQRLYQKRGFVTNSAQAWLHKWY